MTKLFMATIKRLTREIEQIDSFAYGDHEGDPERIAMNLERKRLTY